MLSLILASIFLQIAAVFTHRPPTKNALHFPLQESYQRTGIKRDGQIAVSGLGDVLDVTYSVLIDVGGTQAPLVLDTGSSDLWLVSDGCHSTACTDSGAPRYPQAALHSSGMDVHLLYGDSRTGTHASGPIGTDLAGLAGLLISSQCFAAITDTNTTVLDAGSAGIFGLGFPPVSVIWRELLQAELMGSPPALSQRSHRPLELNTAHSASLPTNAGFLGRPPFPSFAFLTGPPHQHRRQAKSSPSQSSALAIEAFATYGPLVARLVAQGMLAVPMAAITLQRDTFEVGGNAGLLSLGALPAGVQEDSLTWVPVRGYSVAEGGLPPAPDAPDEVHPLLWEIPIDDVYFDGVKLPRSTLSSSSVSLSALVDTGNSLIRGPHDVINGILAPLGGPTGAFDCSTPHNLSFEIGGVFFPVDPRDFARPTDVEADSPRCTAAVAATDPPSEGGFLYSWSLGVPFLKSVLAVFYYGNLTHPSQDPPRVGLLSTVPADAGDALAGAVCAAAAAGGVFPATSEPAPSGINAAAMTGMGGVPMATVLGASDSYASGARESSAARIADFADGWTLLLVISVNLGAALIVFLSL